MTTETAAAPDLGAVPATPALPQIPDDLRAAITDRAANQANAVVGLYGLSGAGKSGLADTACEYAWETFRTTTLCYAADLGGWGNKRLALIRAGIMRVWDPRNHINAFETMELISLGAWPETIEDPERGYARPDVKLILPRGIRYSPICSNGHVAASFTDAAAASQVNVLCPTCGVQVTSTTAQRIAKQIVKPGIFTGVGLRIYDSLTAMNEWGLMQELPRMSAEGLLPVTGSGGSVLGAATAVKSGEFAFGSGSQAQVGFMQNRTYVWLANIRSVPDQVVPSIVIFGVEKSKADDESGGETILGPKIAGNARTSSVPGWVGNCLHASKEPQSDAPGAPLVYRLWLTNHIDPRDPRKIPYLAKHRGTPDGMPDFLEDPPNDHSKAWTQFNLGTFFKLLEAQLQREQERLRARFAELPGQQAAPAADEVLGEAQEIKTGPQRVTGAVAGAGKVAGAVARPVAGAVASRPVAAVPAAVAPAVPAAAPAAPVAAGPAAVPAAPAPAAPPAQAPKVARPIARATTPRPPVAG